ncbi:MAG: hypothetical protein LQ351_000939 [Letrouitia transgressa]|nr:MAG: hypothetical protein LQ351_000939 [Letrouitia transgressa]
MSSNQLNAALQHAGMIPQKDRLALNKSPHHMQELEASFRQSEISHAKFENDLYEKRQENRRLEESLTLGKSRQHETAVNLEVVWNAHRRMGEVLTKVACHVDDGHEAYASYNITELVLELEEQHSKIGVLQSRAKEREEHDQKLVNELNKRLQTESAKYEEALAAQGVKLGQLELDLSRARNECSTVT